MLALVLAAVAQVVVAPPAGALPGFAFTRLSGADRYATAAAVATSTFSSAETVVVATGEDFPDALAAAYLAGARNAAVLLVRRHEVPLATTAALATLRTTTVILVGSTGAVGQDVQDTLAATASTAPGAPTLAVSRIGGDDRFQTMQLIAADPGPAFVGSMAGRRTALLVSGEDFPDAVATAPLSYAMRLPIILSTRAGLDPRAAAALRDLAIDQVVIAGGPGALAPAVETDLAVQGIGVSRRLAGADRSDTSRLVADFAIEAFGFSASHFNLASGERALGGSDALVLGPHGGRDLSPTLITNSSTEPGSVVGFSRGRSSTLIGAHAGGAEAALSPPMLEALAVDAGSTGARPMAGAITPISGPSTGGTAFTITGSGLTGTTAVTFCGAPASGVGVGGGGTILSGITPVRPVGSCSVVVTTPSGASAVPGGFSYLSPAPTLVTITPPSGPVAGGTQVTLAGTNLATTTTVDFCGTAVVPTSTTATAAVAVAPAHAVGSCTVTLTTTAGAVTTTFTYSDAPPPAFATIAPAEGFRTLPGSVTITGTNLGTVTGVSFCGGFPATGISVDAAGTTISARTPNIGPGPARTCSVAVATGGGTATSAADAFSFSPRRALVSHAAAGAVTAANGSSGSGPEASISANGAFVVFESTATDLVPGQVDTNGVSDTFVMNRTNGSVALISRVPGSPVTAANAASQNPVISEDGSVVVFESGATNLITGQSDTNAAADLFVFDRVSGSVTLASHAAGAATTTGNASSAMAGYRPTVSADGGVVAFGSASTNLVGGIDNNNGFDAFVFQRSTGTVTLASRSAAGPTTTGDGAIFDAPQISANGAVVAFTSRATNLVNGQIDANITFDVFAWDRAGGVVSMISSAAGRQAVGADNTSSGPTISSDGRVVAFSSAATNLVAGQLDTNTVFDVYLHDRSTVATTLVSHLPMNAAAVGNDQSAFAKISGDGRAVVFMSSATNLVPGQADVAATQDAFVFDRATAAVVLVSHSAIGNAIAVGVANAPTISASGAFVGFDSAATNLVAGQRDTNGASDAFVFDRSTASSTLVSRVAADSLTTGGGVSFFPVISGDGAAVAFTSAAPNLVAGQIDTNAALDVFGFDR